MREVEKENAVLIVDDTIQEKPYSDGNSLIFWHFDHTFGRSVKGINQLNFVYHADNISVPVAYKLIEKPIQYSDITTKNGSVRLRQPKMKTLVAC